MQLEYKNLKKQYRMYSKELIRKWGSLSIDEQAQNMAVSLFGNVQAMQQLVDTMSNPTLVNLMPKHLKEVLEKTNDIVVNWIKD